MHIEKALHCSFDAQLLRNALEYLHEPYTAWKQTPWATFLLLTVCVYLLSNFRDGLRKTHDRRRAVRFDPSRSSEVDDFRVIWKGLCDFLLAINSNLTVSEIRRLIGWNSPIFPTPPLSNPKFENVPFALDRWNFACGERRHLAN